MAKLFVKYSTMRVRSIMHHCKFPFAWSTSHYCSLITLILTTLKLINPLLPALLSTVTRMHYWYKQLLKQLWKFKYQAAKIQGRGFVSSSQITFYSNHFSSSYFKSQCSQSFYCVCVFYIPTLIHNSFKRMLWSLSPLFDPDINKLENI